MLARGVTLVQKRGEMERVICRLRGLLTVTDIIAAVRHCAVMERIDLSFFSSICSKCRGLACRLRQLNKGVHAVV